MAKSNQVTSSLDPNEVATILATLSSKAPDNEIRDCIRRYDHTKTYSVNKTALRVPTKPILIRTATYLKADPASNKKEAIIHEIICRIQNLLPDTCSVCTKVYKIDINDPPYISCDMCGQEVHKECFNKFFPFVSTDQAPCLNPLKIPGLHFVCHSCEDDIGFPAQKNTGNDSTAKSATSQGNSNSQLNQAKTAPSENKNSDTPSSIAENEKEEEIIHSSQVPSSSASSASPDSADTQKLSSNVLSETVDNEHESVEVIHSSQVPSSSSASPDSPTITHSSSNDVTESSDTSADKKTNVKETPSQNPSLSTSSVLDSATHETGKSKKKAVSILTPEKSDTTTDPSSTKVSKKICPYYKKNKCRYGAKGTGCPFNHPARCQKLLRYGSVLPKGCNKGKQCQLFHPKLCPTSIAKRECFVHGCHFCHIKGTNRKKPGAPAAPTSLANPPENTTKSLSEKINAKANQAKASSTVIGNKSEQSTPPDNSFLELARLIKEELMQAMDTKIALALSSIQFPRLQWTPLAPQIQPQSNMVFPMGFTPQQMPPQFQMHLAQKPQA